MPKNTISSFPKELWRNRLSRYSILIGLGILLIFLAMPIASKYFLKQWLLNNGADRATIGKIKINPFEGRLYLANVFIKRHGQTVLSNSTIYVDIGMEALFDREALLQRANLTDTTIDIKRYDDGSLRIGSYRTNQEKQPQKEDEGLPWVFRARQVVFSDVLIHYSQSGLDLNLLIEKAILQRFTTDPQGDSGSLDLVGKLNDAPVKLQLPVVKVNPKLHLEGKLQVSDLQLETLAEIFKEQFAEFQGSLRADTSIVVKQNQGGLEVALKGETALANLNLRADNWAGSGSIALDGELGYASVQGTDNKIIVDGLLIAQPLFITVPEKKLRLEESALTLKGKTTIDLGEVLHAKSDASLSLKDTTFKLGDLTVTTNPGSWSGKIDYSSEKAAESMSLTADGGIDLQNLLLSLPGTVKWRQGHVALKGDARIFSSEPLKTHYTGSISLTDTGLQTELLSLDSKKLLWQGDGGYVAGTDGLQKTVQLDGTLKALEARVDFPENNFQTAAGSLSIQGDSKISFGREELGYVVNTALEIADLQVAGQENTLTTIANISVDRLRGNGKEMFVDKLIVNNTQLTDTTDSNKHGTLARLGTVTLLDGTIQDFMAVEASSLRIDNGVFFPTHTASGEEDNGPLITLGSGSAAPLRWSRGKGAQIDKVELSKLFARLRTEKDTPGSEAKTTEAKSQPDSKEGRAIPLKINHLSMGEDSALNYTDSTTDPAFHADIAIKTLTMSNIDLNQPQEPVPFELEAMVDKHAPLTVTGSVTPLAVPFSLKQKVILQNYSLQSLSPYVINAVGLALESGQLDLTSDLSIKGDKISSDNKLTIKNIEIAKRDEERSRSFERRLPVPIGLAVDILRDRQDRISLSVPVNGTFSDLQVGIEDIIVTAVTKSIIKGIAPALAYTALGPGGALAYFGMKIGRSLFSTDLPSLEYAPNASMLTNQQKATLDQIGQTLEQKMADGTKTYSICPKVVPGETGSEGSSLSDEERRRELYQLGEKRAQAVKSYLLENFKIDKDQLLICNPTLNYGESARGSVIIRE